MATTAWIGRVTAAFLWRGWAVLVSLCLLAALWQVGHEVYGGLVLPSPMDTLRALGALVAEGVALPAALETARDALMGFGLAAVAGVLIGAAAGLSVTVGRLLEPLVRFFLGVPAIAWVVLALIWFAGSGLAAVFTVVVTTLPVVIIGAMQGARTLDGEVLDMARAFRAPLGVRIVDIYVPHILSYVFPALATAMGLSWKLAVMAEVLGGTAGIGEGLSLARVNIDTADAMAWILLALIMLLSLEGLVMDPLRRRLEPWRATRGQAARERRS
ncbi:NitT/TauT family transport system permease protein [Roseospira visakhapatnamensis]|uniref:NitT/TauT family transport system permease protein n=1 Tax=Roseospira visakhapatnamensis TaxID=390880 RepID=A0A7W6W9S1_9PROT|nr:NitT/TauT family transport system permease protein [Roseospira visakhapatnamensis]